MMDGDVLYSGLEIYPRFKTVNIDLDSVYKQVTETVAGASLSCRSLSEDTD